MDQTQTSPTSSAIQPVDQQALDLTHAIALQESGSGGKPNYSAIGDNGTSKGAYQWQPGNFEAAAKAAGLDPNDFSPQNQDKVAYSEVKAYKDKGYDPGQIASLWNSGSPNNWQNHSGTTTINGKQLSYDTPTYVKGVQKYYQQLTQSQGTQGNGLGALTPQTIQPTAIQSSDNATTPPPTNSNQGLGSDLSGRLGQAGIALSDAASGKINPLSGILQAAGAGAGAINDTVGAGVGELNKAGNFLSGGLLGKFENELGSSASAVGDSLGQTDTGKAVIDGVKSFEQNHPELTNDIGAAGNIAGVIPLLTGGGALLGAGKDALAGALSDAGTNAVTKELGEVTARTVGGRAALANEPDALSVLAQKEYMPSISGGKYSTQEASTALDGAISDIDDNELTPALEKANVPDTASRVPLAQYRQEAVAAAKDQLKDSAPIEKYFDRLKEKYGDYPTLQQMNEAKRIVARNISESGFSSPTYSVDKIVRGTLQKSVEDGAKTLGLGDVGAINQKMARLIKAQNLLKYIEGKTAKSGLIGKVLREGVADAATVAGESAGNATGVPFAGALAGRGAGNLVGSLVKRGSVGGLLGRFVK